MAMLIAEAPQDMRDRLVVVLLSTQLILIQAAEKVDKAGEAM